MNGRCPFGHFVDWSIEYVCDFCGGKVGCCKCQLERHHAAHHIVRSVLILKPRRGPYTPARASA